jgi:hypothetical protein
MPFKLSIFFNKSILVKKEEKEIVIQYFQKSNLRISRVQINLVIQTVQMKLVISGICPELILTVQIMQCLVHYPDVWNSMYLKNIIYILRTFLDVPGHSCCHFQDTSFYVGFINYSINSIKLERSPYLLIKTRQAIELELKSRFYDYSDSQCT